MSTELDEAMETVAGWAGRRVQREVMIAIFMFPEPDRDVSFSLIQPTILQPDSASPTTSPKIIRGDVR